MKVGPPRLLCIDDDPADREALRSYMEILDWTATFCASGAEGYFHAQSTRYDAIVTDQNMPDMTGLGLVECLRMGQGPNARTPVLLNSNILTAEVLLNAERIGIESVAEKPLLLTAFKDGIRCIVRTSPLEQSLKRWCLLMHTSLATRARVIRMAA